MSVRVEHEVDVYKCDGCGDYEEGCGDSCSMCERELCYKCNMGSIYCAKCSPLDKTSDRCGCSGKFSICGLCVRAVLCPDIILEYVADRLGETTEDLEAAAIPWFKQKLVERIASYSAADEAKSKKRKEASEPGTPKADASGGPKTVDESAAAPLSQAKTGEDASVTGEGETEKKRKMEDVGGGDTDAQATKS